MTTLLDDDDTFEDTANPGGAPAEEFEDFDMPPILCGVFRGHISDSKRNPKNEKQHILEFKSEEIETAGSTCAVWIDLSDPRQLNRLRQIAVNVGLKVTPRGTGFRIDGGTKALKNRPGVFVADTYHKDDGSINSSLAWGMPKPDRSPEWDEYAKANKFNDDQIAALKASPGALHPTHHKLFK